MQITSLVVILSFAPFSFSCLFKNDKHKGSWDDEENPRDIDEDCECGLYDEAKKERSWTVFVLKKEESGSRLLCTGAIVTSNLLATSHECLELTSKRFNVYDIWKPKGGATNMIDESQLIVSKDPQNVTSPFTIVQIIYNHRFGINSATKSDPEDDLVLIQVEPHFTSVSKELLPICIPASSDPVTDLRHHSPYFLGLLGSLSGRATNCLGGATTAAPTSPPEAPPPGPSPHPPTEEPPPSATLPPPGSVTGDVVDEDHCDSLDDDIEEEDEPFLCFRRTSGKPPRWGDGTLILDSLSSDHRSFMIGIIASRSGPRERSAEDEGAEFIHFFKISGLIKYIEYHAKRTGSRWCHSDKLAVGRPITTGDLSEAVGRKVGDYPWDNLALNIPPRLETLNCVCGVKNSGGAAGRIIGGETAQQHEYPWMTYIEFYAYQGSTSQKPSGCTGQIINDLFILTAGHCVKGFRYNHDKKQWEPVNPAHPSSFVVYINAHFTPAAGQSDAKMIQRKVLRVYPYPEYKDMWEDTTITNHSVDIAMLVLEEPLPFDSCGDGPRPICIPAKISPELKLSGMIAEIAGWGYTSIFVNQTTGTPSTVGPSPTELQKASIQILSEDACIRVQHKANPNLNRGLCTGNESSLNNAFRGDSGGPLMVKLGGSEQYTLVGTVSNGFPYPTEWMKPGGRKRRELPPLTHYVWYVPVQKFVRWIDYLTWKVWRETGLVIRWCKTSV